MIKLFWFKIILKKHIISVTVKNSYLFFRVSKATSVTNAIVSRWLKLAFSQLRLIIQSAGAENNQILFFFHMKNIETIYFMNSSSLTVTIFHF